MCGAESGIEFELLDSDELKLGSGGFVPLARFARLARLVHLARLVGVFAAVDVAGLPTATRTERAATTAATSPNHDHKARGQVVIQAGRDVSVHRVRRDGDAVVGTMHVLQGVEHAREGDGVNGGRWWWWWGEGCGKVLLLPDVIDDSEWYRLESTVELVGR